MDEYAHLSYDVAEQPRLVCTTHVEPGLVRISMPSSFAGIISKGVISTLNYRMRRPIKTLSSVKVGTHATGSAEAHHGPRTNQQPHEMSYGTSRQTADFSMLAT